MFNKIVIPKIKPLFLISILLILYIILPMSTMKANAYYSATDESQIKTIIGSYFTLRYESNKQMKRVDLSSVLSMDQPDTQKWLIVENDRDELLKLQANLFKLNYLDYKFSLDYESINFKDESNAIATLYESHQVVFEASAPVVSEMSHLKHLITLIKTSKGWLIVKDDYNDETIPPLDGSISAKENVKNNILMHYNEALHQKQLKTQSVNTLSTNGSSNPTPASSNHSYYRDGAVWYINHWWNARNLNYRNFSPNDCTNFISQAMHDSTGAGIVYDQVGSLVWYYTDYYNYSYSWTGVQDYWYYMTNTDQYLTGPYGNQSDICNSQLDRVGW